MKRCVHIRLLATIVMFAWTIQSCVFLFDEQRCRYETVSVVSTEWSNRSLASLYQQIFGLYAEQLRIHLLSGRKALTIRQVQPNVRITIECVKRFPHRCLLKIQP